MATDTAPVNVKIYVQYGTSSGTLKDLYHPEYLRYPHYVEY
jgi:hypothetical protein